MYYYLYDSFLIEKKYQKLINEIETRVAELGISGRVIRLTLLKTAEEAVESILKRDTNPTVIVVGKEETFNQAISAIRNFKENNCVFGFIPVKFFSEIATILDLPMGVESCDVISQRRIIEVDLGQVNGFLFFSYFDLPTNKVFLKTDNWKAFPVKCSKIRVSNLAFRWKKKSEEDYQKEMVSSPQDSLLEIITLKEKKDSFFGKKRHCLDSLFFLKHIWINSLKKDQELCLQLGKKTLKAPLEVKLASKKAKIIVGRDRLIE